MLDGGIAPNCGQHGHCWREREWEKDSTLYYIVLLHVSIAPTLFEELCCGQRRRQFIKTHELLMHCVNLGEGWNDTIGFCIHHLRLKMIRLVHWKRHGQEWPLGPFITELRKKISNAGVKKKVSPFMGWVLNGFLPLPPEMGKRESEVK